MEKSVKLTKPSIFTIQFFTFLIICPIVVYALYKDWTYSFISTFCYCLFCYIDYYNQLKIYNEDLLIVQVREILEQNSMDSYDRDCYQIIFSLPSEELNLKLEYVIVKRKIKNLKIKI